MKIETKEIYRCGHCNKYGLSKGAMVRHEKICYKNPDNFRPCLSCQHLTKRDVIIESDNYTYAETYQNRERKVSLFFCSKKDTFLWTPQNKIRGNEIESGESNMYMPEQCDIYDKESKEMEQFFKSFK